MGDEKRKRELELPIKIIFNEEGINFFIQNKKKLTKFKLADDFEQYGIFFDVFSPASVQRLLLINYVSYIEITRPEFMSRRQEVMDLSKLITYAIFYRRFDEVVFNRVLESDLIKKWNRANPSSIIDRKTSIKNEVLMSSLERNKSLVAAIKQEMLRPLIEEVKGNASLLPEEKNIQIFLAEKYLNNLRPLIWFILSNFKDSDEYMDLLNQIEVSLHEYMDKSKIAEYLSLMVMELAINAENVNIQNFAKQRYKGTLDPNSVMFDPEIRKMVVEEMSHRNHNVYMSWKVGGSDSKSVSSREKLTVRVYNKEAGYLDLKKTVDDTKAATKTKNLLDFYKEGSGGGENSELGLYYLSYLSEECQKVGVHFESLVNQIQSSNLTVITLNLLV